ncbi:sodium/potassium/calcium exchanger 4 isoform X1 [Colletes latitarsis]|uniref:sodium/potassium/calcium exchanger 4 isoform X1 n=2 Tax=Colletes latitarsis TaxID=2605962 RepID=UPI0040351551
MNIRFSRCCAWIVVLSVCFPGTCALLGNESFPSEIDRKRLTGNDDQRPFRGHVKRRLMIDGDIKTEEVCVERSIKDFPNDLFTYEQRRQGAVFLHAVLGFYCFILIAFVCDDYLLPSINRICKSMKISTDVAGATFLAMASSFPEMFVNVIGTFLTETDLGVGTVVGSAVFDTFATPACGALIAAHAISLEWRILSRDCIMYVISVGTLVIIMWDGVITWYEATTLLTLFFLYLVLLFTGKWVMRSCSGGFSGSKIKITNFVENSMPVGSYKQNFRNGFAANHIETISVNVPEQQKNGGTNPEYAQYAEESTKLEDEELPESPFTWPTESNVATKCWFVFTWPLRFLLFITIPDIRRERFKKLYPVTFIMCVIWIAIASYLVSWMMTVVGDTMGIPDSIMGITFLAAGGNMPELASIIILAQQGDGNMAMSNTLGANILDILLCLGLPWTIKCLITNRNVEIVSGALSYSVLSLVVCIVILFAVIASFNFKLNKKVGIICLLLYAIFLAIALLVELNVFFFVNLPMCGE